MNEHSLKDLVVKLNDRNIQRQRESGLTIYAVLTVIVYLIFFLISEFPVFLKNKTDNFVTLTLVGDVIFCALSFLVATIKRRTGVTKIFPNQEFLSIDRSLIPYSLFFVMLAILNFYSHFNSYSGSLIYILFGVIFTVNIALPFIVKSLQLWQDRKSVTRIPEFTYLKSEVTKLIAISSGIYGVILTAAIVFLIANEAVNLTNSEIANSVKYDMHLLGVLLLSFIALQLQENKTLNDELEELEKEIFLKNLPNEEIKKRLEEEYFGQDFSAWVETRKRALSEYFASLYSDLVKVHNLIPTTLDSNVDQFVRQELYNSLFNKREGLVARLKAHTSEFEKQSKRLSHFSSIENDEWHHLTDLHNHYNQEVAKFNEIDINLYNFFNAVQNGKNPQHYPI